jgi:hypothetical protein
MADRIGGGPSAGGWKTGAAEAVGGVLAGGRGRGTGIVGRSASAAGALNAGAAV